MYIPDYDLEGSEQEGLNVRVPPKMKEEIERRRAVASLSMAKWTRKALLFALQYMDEDEVIVAPKAELKKLMLEVLEEEGLLKKE